MIEGRDINLMTARIIKFCPDYTEAMRSGGNGFPTVRFMLGRWVAHLVESLTLAQGMVSWCVAFSPELGSVLTAQSLESASNSVSLLLVMSLSLSPPFFLKNKQT